MCVIDIAADDYHTEASRAKMASGVALTEEDRAPWLDACGKALCAAADTAAGTALKTTSASTENIEDSVAKGGCAPECQSHRQSEYFESTRFCAVLACSALRKAHRDRLREATRSYNFDSLNASDGSGGSRIALQFVLLTAPEKVLLERARARARNTSHFMPPSMLQSQLATLEQPTSDELHADVAIIELSTHTTVKEIVLRALEFAQPRRNS
mmetsp:Transcript_14903/g.39939  ORF Transcript_14903/g.39939 Transcript_14903/m.39939 type:complete len:213 (-) Transcript_14903:4103-4741(-)